MLLYWCELSSSGFGAVGVGIVVDELLHTVFLPSPLQVVAQCDVWHAHVEAHVLLVAVPFAERLASLIVFAERHDYSGAELPRFPVIAQLDDVDVFAPRYLFAPEVALRSDILSREHESPVR